MAVLEYFQWEKQTLVFSTKASLVVIGLLTCLIVLLYFSNAGFSSSLPLRTIHINNKNRNLPYHRPCNENGHSLFLLMAVPSRAVNFRERMAIRNSWGSVVKGDNSLQLFFFLGKEPSKASEEQLAIEKEKYMDIIEFDIQEKYRNLARKVTAMIEWIHLHCNNPKYILKVDDDVFLNSNFLVDYLRNSNVINSIIGCKIKQGYVDRSKYSKYYLTRGEYKPDRFPDYTGGPAYVISGDILGKLYKATEEVPSIFLEDVYITGMCREYIKASVVGHPGISCISRNKKPCGELFRNSITGHPYSSLEIERMWAQLRDNTPC